MPTPNQSGCVVFTFNKLGRAANRVTLQLLKR